MKSQALSTQTIVIIIISLLVLAGVLVYSFTSSKNVEGGIDLQNIENKCELLCLKIQNSAKTLSDCNFMAVTFCDSDGIKCSDYVKCESLPDSESWVIDCNPYCTD